MISLGKWYFNCYHLGDVHISWGDWSDRNGAGGESRILEMIQEYVSRTLGGWINFEDKKPYVTWINSKDFSLGLDSWQLKWLETQKALGWYVFWQLTDM